MMASISDKQYPDHLNPFGSDEEDEDNHISTIQAPTVDEYPDHLDPFQDAEDKTCDLDASRQPADTYDDSLNPFGDEVDEKDQNVQQVPDHNVDTITERTKESSINSSPTAANPFDESEDDEHEKREDVVNNSTSNSSSRLENGTAESVPQDLLEPPKPLPRTKSLLKKELILKNQQRQQMHTQIIQNSPEQINSFSSAASTTSSSSTTTINTNNPSANATVGSFQRRKNKRNAPPVPVNFKRQVSGSFSAIENELENIGDMLAIIEKESYLCQEDLKASYNTNMTQFATSQAKLIELIKRRGSIVRRQRELMYRKRELNLDQLHSDIEYELRMIGNKQRKF